MASERQPLPSGHDKRPGWARGLTAQRQSWRPQPSAAVKVGARRAGYTVSIVVNAILLVLIHGLPNRWFPFVTDAFVDVRWALDLSLSATIVANAFFFAFDASWFRDLIQIALTALTLLVTVVFYRRFPFDFGDSAANNLAHLLLGLLIFALVVAILAQMIAWLVSLARRALPAEGAGTASAGE
jgi:hypothetical protein